MRKRQLFIWFYKKVYMDTLFASFSFILIIFVLEQYLVNIIPLLEVEGAGLPARRNMEFFSNFQLCQRCLNLLWFQDNVVLKILEKGIKKWLVSEVTIEPCWHDGIETHLKMQCYSLTSISAIGIVQCVRDKHSV